MRERRKLQLLLLILKLLLQVLGGHYNQDGLSLAFSSKTVSNKKIVTLFGASWTCHRLSASSSPSDPGTKVSSSQVSFWSLSYSSFRPLSRNISIASNASFDTFSSKNSAILGLVLKLTFYKSLKFIPKDRRNTLVAFKDAISESGRKLSLMVSENQQRALESLLSDLQGAKMSPRRKALYSLIFFLLLVISC